ncbi:MAG: DUF2145 domain-containing protein [Alphaproteobacteria bacterium]
MRLAPLLCTLLMALAPISANAMSSAACGLDTPSLTDFNNALTAAHRMDATLQKMDSPAALVARRGGDITHLGQGLLFTHAAIAIQAADGGWQVVHLLNDCEGSGSSLYREGLGAFFLQAPHSYQAVVQPLPAPLAQSVAEIIADERLAATVHEPRYSLAAHPLSATHQNSNGFVLEVLALAMARHDQPDAKGRGPAQEVLRISGFAGTTITASLLERRIGPLVKANLSLEDQSDPSQPSVVTVRSIMDWLHKDGTLRTTPVEPIVLDGPLR